MKSTLIKDTTKSERIELVKQWEESEGCESSGIDLMEFFRDYIDGVKEISEVNAAFTARYISDEDYANAIKKCHPEKGDMLYSKGGTTGIAKLIDIDEEFANWVHVAVLKFDKSKLNGIFFENMLNGDYCFEQSQRLTKGIANRDLVLSAMAQIKMYRPPMEIQKQFADFVNQVDKSKLYKISTLQFPCIPG